MTAQDRVEGVSSLRVLTPLAEWWRWLCTLFVATAALVGGVRAFLVPQRYEARVTLATVGSSKLPSNLSGLGGLAGLAGITGQGLGPTANPDLVGALLESRRVLLEVAAQPLGPGAGSPNGPGPAARPRTVIVAVTHDSTAGERAPAQVERAMRSLTSVEIDKRTGLITLAVAHADSAVARAVLGGVLETASRTFMELARSQARAQRLGLEARVDSMESQLRRAEGRASAFRGANRVVADFSSLAVEQGQLARDVSIAQQAYLQAVTEREAAVARELEQTPSVVTVDPVPPRLDPLPKFALFFGLAAAVAVTFLAITAVYITDSLRRLQRGAAEDSEAARFLRAARGVPLLRRAAGPADAPAG